MRPIYMIRKQICEIINVKQTKTTLFLSHNLNTNKISKRLRKEFWLKCTRRPEDKFLALFSRMQILTYNVNRVINNINEK